MGKKKPSKLWYVLAAQPGREKKLVKFMQLRAKVKGLEKKLGKVLIPHHVEERKVQGEWKLRRVKSMSGYILVEMNWDEDMFHLMEACKVKGAFGLLPLRPTFTFKDPITKRARKRLPKRVSELDDLEEWVPTSVPTEEAAMLLLRDKEKKNKAKVEKQPAKFGKGDKVKINSGSFQDYVGYVSKVREKEFGWEYTVQVKVLGHPVDVSVSYKDVDIAD